MAELLVWQQPEILEVQIHLVGDCSLGGKPEVVLVDQDWQADKQQVKYHPFVVQEGIWEEKKEREREESIKYSHNCTVIKY